MYGQRGFYCVHSLWSSGSLPGMCPFPKKVPHLQGDNQGDRAHISLMSEERSGRIVGRQKLSEQRMPRCVRQDFLDLEFGKALIQGAWSSES